MVTNYENSCGVGLGRIYELFPIYVGETFCLKSCCGEGSVRIHGHNLCSVESHIFKILAVVMVLCVAMDTLCVP